MSPEAKYSRTGQCADQQDQVKHFFPIGITTRKHQADPAGSPPYAPERGPVVLRLPSIAHMLAGMPSSASRCGRCWVTR